MYDLSNFESLFVPILVTMPRILATFAVVPMFSGRVMTGFIRHSFVVMLAMFFAPVVGENVPQLHALTMLTIVAKEILIGLMLGLAFGLFLWAIQAVGDIIDFQTGAANATFFDPVTGHEGGPTGSFLSKLLITLFISIGGLLMMLGILVESYKIWPITSFMPHIDAIIEQFVIRQGDTLFTWIIKLGAPVVLVLLLTDFGLGLVSRFAPQLNVFVFAQPLKGFLATLMMILFLTFVFDLMQTFMQPGNDVLSFLKAML